MISRGEGAPPAESAEWYDYWCKARLQWYIDLGIPAEMLILRPHDADELSHYSSGTSDIVACAEQHAQV